MNSITAPFPSSTADSSAVDITVDDLARGFEDTSVSVPAPTRTPPPTPSITRTTALAAPLPGRPTRTLRAHVTSAYVEPWPPPTHDDDVWPETPSASRRLVVVLKLEDGSSAYSVTYGSPLLPDLTAEGLRAFGWHGERDAVGQPFVTAVELHVRVQAQFQLGLGDVQTVTGLTVGAPDTGLDTLDTLAPTQRGASPSIEEAAP